MPKIAAAYIRVSTNDQTEYSPESQIKLLIEYAKRNDMILPSEFIFRDDGISGRTAEKRPAFMQMIGTAKKKPRPFDVILVWKFSRFARNRQDAILYKSMLRKDLGIDVVSVSENIGDDKMSILIEAMIEAMDEYYSINLSEEVRRGMTERVKRGECVTAAPYGYDIAEKKLIINIEQAEHIRLVYDEFLNGTSMYAIAKKMQLLGIKTNRGNSWTNRTVRYVLTNPVYCGKVRWNPEGINNYYSGLPDPSTLIIEGVHDKIIDTNTFDQTQERLKQYLKMYESSHATRAANQVAGKNGPYMLHGLVKCSSCGASMTRVAGGLNCCNYAHGKCNTSHYIVFNKVNYMVLNVLESQLTTQQFNIISKTSSIETKNQEELIQKQLTSLQNILTRHKEAYAAGIDTIAEYKVNKENISNQIRDLQEKLKNTPKIKIDKKAYAKEKAALLPDLLNKEVDEDTKNKILRSFVDHVIYNKSSETVTISLYN